MKNRIIMSFVFSLLAVVVLATSAYAGTTRQTEEGIVNQIEISLDLIHETLTSAIDGSPFNAYYNSETGRVDFISMGGESLGYRYVQCEEDFRKLVEINAEVTRQPIAQRIENDRVNRNVSRIDVQARTLIECDEDGNKTETFLSDEFRTLFPDSRVFSSNDTFCEEQIFPFYETDSSTFDIEQIVPFLEADSCEFNGEQFEPFFNTGPISMWVPYSNNPRPIAGRSVLVGGRYYDTNYYLHRSVEFRTFGFPVGMVTIDAYLTNLIGDCFSIHFDVARNSEVFHTLEYVGEPYGAWVSSFCGSFSHVALQFRATEIYHGFQPYVQRGITNNINCQGYAFFTNDAPFGWFTKNHWNYWISPTSSIPDVLTSVRFAMPAYLSINFPNGRWREVPNINVPLNFGEWMVVMKIGKVVTNGVTQRFDYHFWYRTSNGRWAHKRGTDHSSELLPHGITPLNHQIPAPHLGVNNFYNSDPVVYAVRSW